MKSKDCGLGIEQLENKRVLSSIVAILDSGVDIYHKDLIDNIWVNTQEIKNNNIDDDNNGYIDDIHGWNFISNNNNVLDVYGHGTHVAGIVQGVNPTVKIIPLKMISDSGSGSTSAVIAALNYVLNLKARGENIGVINASWTLGSYAPSLVKDKFVALGNLDTLIVSAAGNNATNIDINPNYPSSFKLPNIISVASITPERVLAGSSNYGPQTVHLAARGVMVNSTWPGNRYVTLSGTSMAAPMVSGKVSMMSGSVSEKEFALLSETVKTDGLSSKVISGGYLKESWSFVAEPVTPEIIQGRAGIMSINRVYGWGHSSWLKEKPVLIKVMVNNRLVATKWANLYRPDLFGALGSVNHGFDIRLNRFMFRRGWNVMRIYAVNTENNNMQLLGSKNIRRYI